MLGVLAVFAAGCPEPPVPVDDGSSTGGSGDASGTSSPDASSTLTGASSESEGPDDSGSSTTSTSSTGDDDSTTGPTSSGQARVVVREPIVGTDVFDLMLYEYADGELTPPQSITPELPAGGGIGPIHLAETGTAVAACTVDPAQEARPCAAIDLTTHPPGPPQTLVTGPVATSSIVSITEYVEATESFVFRVTDLDEVAPDSIYVASFAGGVLQVPQLAAEGSATEGIDLNPRVRADGAWVGYVNVPDAGPRNAFVAPLDAPDPGSAMMVSDLVDPALRASTPVFVSGHEAVLYTVDDEVAGSTDDSLWFVDISGPVPGAPIRVDDPLTDVLDVRGPAVAPDGHALVYWAGMNGSLVGDLMFVELSTGVPQPPVTVSTLGAEQALLSDFEWSPDSRLLSYRAAHQQPETYDLHVVDVAGEAPGEPMLVTGGLVPTGDVLEQRFDASSSWLYYVAQQESEEAQLYRVDVSGPEPGTPQRVSGGTGVLTGEIIPSPDWSMVLYTVWTPSDGTQLELVDVSGDEPGEAIRINAPLAEGASVSYGADFSLDGSVVTYQQGVNQPDAPSAVELVDLASLEVFHVSDDAQGVFPIVD